jgi:adenosylcobinamide kinase / adenosylcobinamide-phosphate guanylyltransferase
MTTERQIILVTGPARSGKSEWAETLAWRSRKPVIYLATSRVDDRDREWCDRIQRHRVRRPEHWQTVEIPIELSAFIHICSPGACLLIDSLGTWVANAIEQNEEDWQKTRDDFLFSLQNASVEILLVAEETGWGVVPAYPVGRLFRDRLGSLIRRVGAIADTVYLVTGGHALDLTQLGQRLPDSPS